MRFSNVHQFLLSIKKKYVHLSINNQFLHLTSNTFFFISQGRFGRVIVIPNDGDNNLLRPEVFKELRILDQLIQNTTVFQDGEEFKYADVCAKWQDECFNNDILSLDKIMDEVCGLQ